MDCKYEYICKMKQPVLCELCNKSYTIGVMKNHKQTKMHIENTRNHGVPSSWCSSDFGISTGLHRLRREVLCIYERDGACFKDWHRRNLKTCLCWTKLRSCRMRCVTRWQSLLCRRKTRLQKEQSVTHSARPGAPVPHL